MIEENYEVQIPDLLIKYSSIKNHFMKDEVLRKAAYDDGRRTILSAADCLECLKTAKNNHYLQVRLLLLPVERASLSCVALNFVKVILKNCISPLMVLELRDQREDSYTVEPYKIIPVNNHHNHLVSILATETSLN